MKTKLKAKLTTLLTMAFLTANYILVYASQTDLENTPLVKGTKNLLTVGGAIITGLAALVTAIMASINGYRWLTTDDQQKAQAKAAFIHTFGIGVLVICASGLVTAIFAFYQ